MNNIWLYDVECFAFDWLIVARDVETGAEQVFHNNPQRLKNWIDSVKPILGGYNVKHYDKWILKAIYYGADPGLVKQLNDFIIVEKKNGWDFEFLKMKRDPAIQFDLMDDIAVALRLKEIEGNLHMNIEESSIPFTLDRPLTASEYDEVLAYCRHDVGATVELYKERQDYLKSKVAVGAMCDLSPEESMKLTNAKLTAEFLGAMETKKKWEDRDVYEFPGNLVIEKYPEVLQFFGNVDPGRKRRLTTAIAGVPHVLAWGGLHGAKECYHTKRIDNRKVISIDVASYYPSLMIVNGYMSRNVPDPEEFKRVYERRLAAKKAGDKATSDALKLVLNTTFGAMNNQYNKLYDPKMALAVCVSGQLYLIDLIEKLESVPSFELIQSNTDGLIVAYAEEDEFDIMDVISEWELRTGFVMETDEIEVIYQKDVNNYVQRSANGKIKVKGGYVSNYDGGTFKQRSLVIVAQAIVTYLLDRKKPKDTINACDEMWKFQMVVKAGSTYDQVLWEEFDGDTEVQFTNRVYASKDEFHGTLYKVKLPKGEGQKERRDKIANLPDNCFIDNRNECNLDMIDKQFYIDLAKKRINDYVGMNLL